MATPEIFISYAWRDESLNVTEELDAFFQSKDILIKRDNRDIGYKGLVKEYMQQLGRGKYIVVVLSDAYFKSKSCMFELLQMKEHGEMDDRIFPIAAPGTSFYEAENLLEYVNYWDEKIEKLETLIKQTKSSANLQGIREDLDLYVEIRQNISSLLNFLRNINTHPLKGSNFDPLYEAIQAKMQQDEEEAPAAGAEDAPAPPGERKAAGTSSKASASRAKISISTLRDLIEESFDIEEFRDLCDDLEINFDTLRGEGLKSKAREVAKRMQRLKRMDEFLDLLKEQRPETFGDL